MAKPPRKSELTTLPPPNVVRYRFPLNNLPLLASVAGSGLSLVGSGAVAMLGARLAREKETGSAAMAATTASDLELYDLRRLGMLSTQVSNEFALNPLDLQPMALGTSTDMDPRLQLAMANQRSGKRGLMTSSTAGDEVAVIARVESREAWEEQADVIPGAVLGETDRGGWIVTGRIPIDRAEAVRTAPGVISLKAAQPVRPALKSTIDAMGAGPQALPVGFLPAGGAGVVIGIVDFGCDFAHQNFRSAAGATRIEAIWDQGGIAAADSPMGYGRLYQPDAINAALAAADPYGALGYGPEPDAPNDIGSHGTHVMDIAAGNGRGSGQAGVAPEATLIFVEASSSDISWAGPGTVNQAFGDSVQLLEAVRFVFDQAGARPCVVNLSLGTNGGPHDGSSLVEQGLDALVHEAPNRAVVIAASNSQNDGIHTSGQVQAGASVDITWIHTPRGGGEVELWYAGTERLVVELVAPDGTRFGPVDPGKNLPLGSNEVVIFISSRIGDPNNGDNVIGVWVADNVSGGAWTIRLTAHGDNPVDFHAWIERNDDAQSTFAAPIPTHTLGSISTGLETIVVGSFDAHKPSLPLSNFSSSGPTRDGREKPEVSASGHAVIAARSRTTGGVTRKSGTSMAAPAVAGLVALLYADAQHHGRDLPIAALRARLFSSVKRNPPRGEAETWDPRYGLGRAHV
jgi:subtilisin family serine protease